MSDVQSELSSYVKCRCQHCDTSIEFDAGQLTTENSVALCPHCGLETTLFVPPTPKSEQKKPVPQQKRVELFYYKAGDQEKGPYTFEQLNSLWNSGQITGNALFRGEDSTQWLSLAERIGQSQNQNLPLPKIYNYLLKIICLAGLIAFFLPNVTISIPIIGKMEISMLDFLTPKSNSANNSATTDQVQPEKPNIQSVMSDNDFKFNKASLGGIICLVSAFGLLAFYLLTLVWGVFAFALRKTFSSLNFIWLLLALQFPILFSIGTHLILNSLKSDAMSDAVKNSNGDPGEALGNALGTALINQFSIQAGTILWVLMALAVCAISLSVLSRKSALAVR